MYVCMYVCIILIICWTTAQDQGQASDRVNWFIAMQPMACFPQGMGCQQSRQVPNITHWKWSQRQALEVLLRHFGTQWRAANPDLISPRFPSRTRTCCEATDCDLDMGWGRKLRLRCQFAAASFNKAESVPSKAELDEVPKLLNRPITFAVAA